MEARGVGERHDIAGAEVGDRLLGLLRQLKGRHALVGEVRGLGCVLGVELVRDRGTKEPAGKETAKVVYSCFERGLLLYYSGLYSNVLEFTPPLVLTRADAERGVELLDQALTEVESGQFPDERLVPYVGW